MPEDIAAVVDAARVRAFVGRSSEVAHFRTALSGSTSTRVLFLHGPGGIGKSTVLQRLRILAEASGRSVVSVDGVDIGSAQDLLQSALDTVRADGSPLRADGSPLRADGSPLRADGSPLRAAGPDHLRPLPGDGVHAGGERPWVFLIDGYERLTNLDDWIRVRLVACLPADTVVVIAGRDAPPLAWQTDPGWRAVMVALPLSPFPDEQSRQLLDLAGVPSTGCDRLTALGHGHPLTLAMLASATVAGTRIEDFSDAPDLVASLVGRLVDEAPDDDHALAMSLCAHTWLTTPELVDELLGRAAPEVWTWLETRPWVTRGTHGAYPHDLVRDVLDADLRRRSPATYRRINRLVHTHAWAAIHSEDDAERRLWAHQKLFLHPRSPFAGSFWALRSAGAGAVSAGRPADHPTVLQVIENYRGTEERAIAESWLAAQPENLSVVRSGFGLDAFVFHGILPADGLPPPGDLVSRAALDHAAATAPARPGEQISIARFLVGQGGNDNDAYAVVTGAVSGTILWTTRPLAWSFVAAADGEFWGRAFDYLTLSLVGELSGNGVDYSLFGIDWRRLTPARWFALMGDRELSGETGPAPEHLLQPAPLSREAFGEAVKLALRNLRRPDLLQSSPLFGTRLAVAELGAPSDATALRTILLDGLQSLATEPRTSHLGRVLDRTYVHGAPTQEAAAEVLDLPFSTYRRHLNRGLEELTDLLWRIEIGAVDRSVVSSS